MKRALDQQNGDPAAKRSRAGDGGGASGPERVTFTCCETGRQMEFFFGVDNSAAGDGDGDGGGEDGGVVLCFGRKGLGINDLAISRRHFRLRWFKGTMELEAVRLSLSLLRPCAAMFLLLTPRAARPAPADRVPDTAARGRRVQCGICGADGAATDLLGRHHPAVGQQALVCAAVWRAARRPRGKQQEHGVGRVGRGGGGPERDGRHRRAMHYFMTHPRHTHGHTDTGEQRKKKIG